MISIAAIAYNRMFNADTVQSVTNDRRENFIIMNNRFDKTIVNLRNPATERSNRVKRVGVRANWDSINLVNVDIYIILLH